jgi:hypothetical protein
VGFISVARILLRGVLRGCAVGHAAQRQGR